jgi:hypothetical protein
MVIHSVTAVPRPSSRTRSGVSATSGMVCVTSATGRKARVKPGASRPATARAKAKASPAAMPTRVIGSVWARAARSRACAWGAVSARNRYCTTAQGVLPSMSGTCSAQRIAHHRAKGISTAATPSNGDAAPAPWSACGGAAGFRLSDSDAPSIRREITAKTA